MHADSSASPEMERNGPVRVVDLELPDHQLSEALFGTGIQVTRCRLVFHHMLPAPSEARLQAVLEHGLALVYEKLADGPWAPNGLLVPWGQIAYITFLYD